MKMASHTGNKTVLIIASHYPPETRVGGVIRVAKLVKYLPILGWNPVVVTTKGDKVAGGGDLLAKEIAGIGHVYRLPRLDMRKPFHVVKNLLSSLRRIRLAAGHGRKVQGGDDASPRQPLASRILVPDHLAMWGILAALRSVGVILTRKVDAIYATSPLQSGLLAGYVASKITGIPFVVEMRDPWTTNPMGYPRASGLLRWIDSKLEERILLAAGRIVVINENFIGPIRASFPAVDAGNFVVIPNGFDFDDLRGVAPIQNDRFTIVHAGNFYPGRTPVPFLAALANLALKRPDIRSNWTLKFVGSGREYSSVVKELGIEKMVEFVDFVPHNVALGHMLGADLLLLVPGIGKGTMSGKIFEYIASRKPVLVVADECAAADLVLQWRIGIVVPPHDADELADRCVGFVEDLQSGRYDYPDVTPLLDAYDRRGIARRCAEVMGAVAALNK